MNPLTIVGLVVLSISLLANAVLTKIYLGVRTQLTVATEARDQARGLANMCSDATEALQEQATKRQAENKRAVATAYAKGLQYEQNAIAILGTPATQPGNDCASANDRFNNYLQGRVRP